MAIQSDDRLWKQAKIACICIMSASAVGMLLVSHNPFPGMASSEPPQSVLECPAVPAPPPPANDTPTPPQPPSEETTVTAPIQFDFTLIQPPTQVFAYIQHPLVVPSQPMSLSVPDFHVIDQRDNPLTIRWQDLEHDMIGNRVEDPLSVQWQGFEYVPPARLPLTFDIAPRHMIFELPYQSDTDNTATDTPQKTDDATGSNATQQPADDSSPSSTQTTVPSVFDVFVGTHF